MLLAAGADPNVPSAPGRTPLMGCCLPRDGADGAGVYGVLDAILSAAAAAPPRADANASHQQRATVDDDGDELRPSDVMVDDRLRPSDIMADDDGRRAAAGAMLPVRWAGGLELDARNDGGETALMLAAGRDDAEAVRRLLAAGADPRGAAESSPRDGAARTLLVAALQRRADDGQPPARERPPPAPPAQAAGGGGSGRNCAQS